MEWQPTQHEDARGVVRKDGVFTEGGADVSKGLTNCVMPSHFAPNCVDNWFLIKYKKSMHEVLEVSRQGLRRRGRALGLRSNRNL